MTKTIDEFSAIAVKEDFIMDDTNVEIEIDTLRDDLRRLRDDIVTLTQTISELTAKQAADGISAAQSAATQAGEKIAETLQKATDGAKQVGTDGIAALEEKIIERPITSVLIALGLGMLFTKLTDRN